MHTDQAWGSFRHGSLAVPPGGSFLPGEELVPGVPLAIFGVAYKTCDREVGIENGPFSRLYLLAQSE